MRFVRRILPVQSILLSKETPVEHPDFLPLEVKREILYLKARPINRIFFFRKVKVY